MNPSQPHHAEIMIVDDNEDNVKLLAETLTAAGYAIRPARSAALALRSIQAKLPDLILLDVRMPDMDGFEMCRRLKADEKTRSIPVIFITILENAQDKIKGFELGAVDYITKPFSEAEALARVRTHLELRHHQEHLEELVQERTAKLQQTIVEHRRAEAALRDNEKRLASIVDTVGDAIFLLRVEPHDVYRFVSINLSFQRITGLPASAVEGKRVDEIIPVPSLSMALERYRQAIASRSIARWEETSAYPTGILTGEISVAPIFDENDHCTYLVGAAHDITERKRAEEKLRASEASLREAQRLTHIGNWQWTAATDAVTWSEELYRINGRDPNLPPPAYAEMPVCYTPESWERLSAAVAKALQTGEAYELDLDLIRLDGSIINTFSRGAADYDASGAVVGLHGTVQDITERKQADAALRENEQRLRMIFETMSEGLALNEIVYDENGEMEDYRILEVNPAFYSTADYRGEKAAGSLATELYGMTKDLIREFWKQHKEKKSTAYTEMISPLGNRWFFVATSPFVNDRFITSFMDITERKRAEEELRGSEGRFHSLVASLSDVIYTLDTDQRHTAVYGDWVERSGLTPEFFVGKTAREIFGAEAALVHEEANQRALNGEATIYEWSAPSASGMIHYQTMVSPLRNSQAEIVGVVGVGRDITERKQAEEKLRESEEKYRTVADFTYNWEAWHAPYGEYLYVSPSCERITGYTAAEFLANANLIVDIAHPDDREKVIEHFQLVTHQAQLDDIQLDFRIVTRGGEIRWISHNCTGVYGENGKWLGRRESNLDITTRKQAEEELRQAEAKYRDIFENAIEGIFQSTVDGRFINVNAAMARIFGYASPKEMIESVGNNIAERIYADPSQRAEFIGMMNQSGEAKKFEMENIRKDGGVIWTRTSARAIKDVRGDIQYIEGFLEDITEQRRTMFRQETMYRLLRSISGELDLHRLAQAAAETIVLATHYPHVCVALLHEDGEHWEVIGAAGKLAAQVGTTYPIHQGVIGRALKTRRMQRVRDVLDDKSYVRDAGMGDDAVLRSEIVAPALIGKRVIGALNIESVHVNAFDDGDATMIQSLADTIALGLENARLYKEAQREIVERTQAEMDLREANKKLISLHDSLRDQATRDAMTGLYNRRYLNETIEREIARAKREDYSISVMIIDVDHFKTFNDSYGHDFGDYVLLKLSALLRENIRVGDIACRYGGDEFVIVMPGAGREDAKHRAESIHEKFGAAPVKHGGVEVSATLSIGVSIFPQHGEDGDALFRSADAALYRAKDAGRNRVRVWEGA